MVDTTDNTAWSELALRIVRESGYGRLSAVGGAARRIGEAAIAGRTAEEPSGNGHYTAPTSACKAANSHNSEEQLTR